MSTNYCSYRMATKAGMRYLAGLWLLAWLSSAPVVAAYEYAIKASFLYNFTLFVTWPESALPQDAPHHLCILGEDPFGPHLDVLSSEPLPHPIHIINLARAEEAIIQSCHTLFISQSESERLKEILALVSPYPILTVSDITDFTAAGGMVEFLLQDRKIRLCLFPEAAHWAGLEISPLLRNIAKIRAPPVDLPLPPPDTLEEPPPHRAWREGLPWDIEPEPPPAAPEPPPPEPEYVRMRKWARAWLVENLELLGMGFGLILLGTIIVVVVLARLTLK